jgi:PAS domain S-box-containing protein
MKNWLGKAGGEISGARSKKDLICLGAALVIAVAAFAVDLATPRGVAAGVFPHLIAIAFTAWSSLRFAPFFVAALATLFTAVGFVLTDGGIIHIVAVNRVFLIAAYWLFAFLVHLKQEADRKLLLGYAELEQTIAARTRELEESEGRLRLITDRVPAMIAYVGADQRYRFVNAYYGEVVGMPDGRAFGRHLREVLGEEFYEVAKPNIERALTGQTVRCAVNLMTPNGRRDFRVMYLPHWNEEKKVAGFVLLALDTAEEKELQRKLEQV